MISLTVKQAKAGFFDRAAVGNAVDAATKKVLSKAGAFVRLDAKSSIKQARQKALGELTEDERKIYERRIKEWKKDKGKKKPKRPVASSRPGEPPRSVVGTLKKFLFFAYDAQKKSVVIGPAKVNAKGDAPAPLEFGGASTISTAKGRRTATIKKRPYMAPALAKNESKIQEMYRDSIKVK